MFKGIMLLALVSCAMAAGGFVKQPINPLTIERAFIVLSLANSAGSNSVLNTLGSLKPKMVYYGSQIVAGMNHAVIYQSQVDQNMFVCAKVWEKLNNDGFEIIKTGSGKTFAEAAAACSIPADTPAA